MAQTIDIPAEAATRAKELGYRIRLARTRRGMTIPDLAAKVGIHRKTLQALELGRASATLGVFVTVLWALGLEKTLDAVADPDTDTHGRALEASRRPARVRKSRKLKNEYDF